MKCALVVTTIQAPNDVMRALADECRRTAAPFFVVGDRKSPPEFQLEGATYFSLDRQHSYFGAWSRALPVGHYVRKNLGYLAALESGCDWIIETDDDNFPLAGFLQPPAARVHARRVRAASHWVNAYRYFAPTEPVWPRGYPLEALAADTGTATDYPDHETEAVLVQGLADDNPDVDAVYRLTRPLPVRFATGAPLVLDRGQWCPFNSQNTWFRRDIAPLLYLPSHCSFRMTDIWRSFVAQRCLWECGHRVLFVAPTVRQERNAHNLLHDFADEVPGYLHNNRIASILEACSLRGDPPADLIRCYESLVKEKVIPEAELPLVRGWVDEVTRRLQGLHA